MTRKAAAFSLPETLVAVAVASLLFGVVYLSHLTLQRSYAGSHEFAQNVAAGDRLLDYLSMDLRRALRVNQGPVASASPLRGAGNRFVITETSPLCITVPDYYASNAVGNTRYQEVKYPSGSGVQPFASVTQIIHPVTGTLLDPNDSKNWLYGFKVAFQPPGSLGVPPTDEIEVRYQRMTRAQHDPAGSAGDGTVCIFRAEYKSGTRISALENEEVASGIDAPMTAASAPDTAALNNLSVTSQDAAGTSFLVQFAFTSRLAARSTGQQASVVGTGASTVVTLRNPRRD